MSVDFEENSNVSFNPNINNGFGGTKPVGKITQIFMSLGLGSSPDVAQVFVLIVAIIFFALSIFIYFF